MKSQQATYRGEIMDEDDDVYIYEPCVQNPKLIDKFMMVNGHKTLVLCSNTLKQE